MKLSELDGIGPATEEKLARRGIHDVFQLLVHSTAEVADMIGSDNISAMQLFEKARRKLQEEGIMDKTFRSGKEVEKDNEGKQKISTGCRELDKLLTGGLETGSVTEIYGEFGCGKTQFSHTMAVRVQLPKENKGLESKTIYLDTEDTFRATRIRKIASKLGLDEDQVLENITVARAHNSAEQKLIMDEIENLVRKNNDYRLIIVDSATGLFREDYPGRDHLSERQKYLGMFLSQCERIAKAHKIAVIWTNQVMQSPSGNPYIDPIMAIGGPSLAHKSTYRIYFKKAGKKRIAKMVDSPEHAETEVMFALSESGVVDLEVKEAEEKEAKKAETKKKKQEKLSEE